MGQNNNVTIKNSQIKAFSELLYKMKLRGKASRMRSRFLKMLQERYQLIMDEVEDLQREYAELDEDGNVLFETVKLPDGSETQTFKVNNVKKFNQEIQELEDELFIVVVNDENREMIYSVSESVLDCDMEFSEQEAMIYDALCEVLESI